MPWAGLIGVNEFPTLSCAEAHLRPVVESQRALRVGRTDYRRCRVERKLQGRANVNPTVVIPPTAETRRQASTGRGRQENDDQGGDNGITSLHRSMARQRGIRQAILCFDHAAGQKAPEYAAKSGSCLAGAYRAALTRRRNEAAHPRGRESPKFVGKMPRGGYAKKRKEVRPFRREDNNSGRLLVRRGFRNSNRPGPGARQALDHPLISYLRSVLVFRNCDTTVSRPA